MNSEAIDLAETNMIRTQAACEITSQLWFQRTQNPMSI